MRQLVEAREEQPRTITLRFAYELGCLGQAPPHERSTVRLRPDRYDAGRHIPAPEPLFAVRPWPRSANFCRGISPTRHQAALTDYLARWATGGIRIAGKDSRRSATFSLGCGTRDHLSVHSRRNVQGRDKRIR